MIQLNPMVPFWHVASKQPCYAFLVTDYSQEHDLCFTCLMQDGVIYCARAAELRAQENISLGRQKSAVNAKPDWFESAAREWKAAAPQADVSVAPAGPIPEPGHILYVE